MKDELKNTIVEKAKTMKTKDDLLALLNVIRLEIYPHGYEFTQELLNFCCTPDLTSKRFFRFFIPKKSGGKRTIDAPVGSYKRVLKCVSILLESLYTPSAFAMGFANGKSVVNNAEVHLGQTYVFNIDLKDFFPSIERPRISKRLTLSPFGFPPVVADQIAKLCCIRSERKDKYLRFISVLPQGSPASPILTNAICDNLDRRLSRLASVYGANYSRYADDITFSSGHNLYNQDSTFCRRLLATIKDEGFAVNQEKTRLQKKGNRQVVTGLIVGDKVNTQRKYAREIRQILYIWKKFGYNTAWQRYNVHHPYQMNIDSLEHPMNLCNVIAGKLNYLKMVKGGQDQTYIRLKSIFDSLNKKDVKIADDKLIYISTELLSSFETRAGIEIKQEDITITDQKTQEQKSISRLFFMRGDKKVSLAMSSKIKSFMQDRKKCQISRCRRKGKEFWLVHLPLGEAKIEAKIDGMLDVLTF